MMIFAAQLALYPLKLKNYAFEKGHLPYLLFHLFQTYISLQFIPPLVVPFRISNKANRVIKV